MSHARPWRCRRDMDLARTLNGRIARRAALLVGGIIAIVALLVAAVAPVSAGGYRCGSALLPADRDEYLAPNDEYASIGPGDYYPPLEARERLQAIGKECDTARQLRLTRAGVGVLAGAAVAVGGALFRNRD